MTNFVPYKYIVLMYSLSQIFFWKPFILFVFWNKHTIVSVALIKHNILYPQNWKYILYDSLFSPSIYSIPFFPGYDSMHMSSSVHFLWT